MSIAWLRSEMIPVGTVLKRWNPQLGVDHFGIAAEWSERGQLVIHSAKEKGVSYTTLTEFASGEIVDVVRYSQGPNEGEHILARAQSQIGRPFNLLSANCEQFANWTVTDDGSSEQLRNYGWGIAAIVGLTWFWGSSDQAA